MEKQLNKKKIENGTGRWMQHRQQMKKVKIKEELDIECNVN